MIDDRLIEAVGIMAVLVIAILCVGFIWARHEQRRQ